MTNDSVIPSLSPHLPSPHNPQLITVWSPADHHVIPSCSLCDPQLITMWSPADHYVIPSWSSCDPQLITMWSPADHNMIPQLITMWSPADHNMIPQLITMWSTADHNVIHSWLSCDPQMISAWSSADPPADLADSKLPWMWFPAKTLTLQKTCVTFLFVWRTARCSAYPGYTGKIYLRIF
jgi:hypothetical protein